MEPPPTFQTTISNDGQAVGSFNLALWILSEESRSVTGTKTGLLPLTRAPRSIPQLKKRFRLQAMAS